MVLLSSGGDKHLKKKTNIKDETVEERKGTLNRCIYCTEHCILLRISFSCECWFIRNLLYFQLRINCITHFKLILHEKSHSIDRKFIFSILVSVSFLFVFRPSLYQIEWLNLQLIAWIAFKFFVCLTF